MFKDKIFLTAILISLITHGVILFQNSNLSSFAANKNNQKVEVSYIKQVREVKSEFKAHLVKNEPFLKIDQKITADKSVPPPYVDKESIFKNANTISSREVDFAKPAFANPDVIAIKKKITVPPLNLDKINNPSYISYYQIVREKIKRAAYQNYTRQDTGEVYLSFIISNDGFLKDSRLVEEKSTSIQYLREIALRSLRDASPFPNFPKDLNYPSLSFNVVISFQIE